MNTVTLMGRLAQDPQIRQTAGGEAFNFNFAVNRRFIRTESGDPQADFFTCVAFGKTAERLGKCGITKGTKLLIQGELRNNTYTDKNGQKRTTTQIIVNDFDFCESKNATPQAAAPVPTTATARPDTNTRPTRAQDMAPTDFMALNDGIDAELPFY